MKITAEGEFYLIKWKDYIDKYNTWEKKEHLNEAALQYIEKHPVPLITDSEE